MAQKVNKFKAHYTLASIGFHSMQCSYAVSLLTFSTTFLERFIVVFAIYFICIQRLSHSEEWKIHAFFLLTLHVTPLKPAFLQWKIHWQIELLVSFTTGDRHMSVTFFLWKDRFNTCYDRTGICGSQSHWTWTLQSSLSICLESLFFILSSDKHWNKFF